MIQIKKTILTLVALLAVTTGAWADETLLLTIENKDYKSFTSGSMTFDDMVTVTFSNEVYNDGDQDGWYGGVSLLTVAGTNGYTITSCKFYTNLGTASTGYNVEGESPSVYLSGGYVYTDDSKSVFLGNVGITKIEVYGTAPSASSATPVDIDWDGETKTGTFTMPGGNVTLEPEYYPLANLAFQGLTAAEDAAAKTDAPLAVLADGAVTGGTLMYYVATDKNFSQADAIALAETQWSAAIPTAETVDAAGTCYVWYYIKGDAEHSDTDPIPLVVTLLPEPTYAVTFAEGTDPKEWTASPNTDVKKGQTVTVTYSGSKKVIGVKAEKKAAAPATITVTWNNNDMPGTGCGSSFTKDGVTITAGFIDFDQKIFMSGGTFTTTLGNFTKIEVTADSWGASGTGWSGKTWTGNASSVSYDGDIMGMVKVVFTIEPTN